MQLPGPPWAVEVVRWVLRWIDALAIASAQHKAHPGIKAKPVLWDCVVLLTEVVLCGLCEVVVRQQYI